MYNLNLTDIKVGNQYQIESKYYYCVYATVIEDQCGEDKENLHGPNWLGWKIRVDESFGGLSPLEVGEEISIGWDSEFPHYSGIKIKDIGSLTDYSGFDI